jgi:hypothetical protein
MRDIVQSRQVITQSFLTWHRTRQYDKETGNVVTRGGRHNQVHQATMVVACRYWFELTDGFWGQFGITQLPHLQASDLLPTVIAGCKPKHLDGMKNYVGLVEYLCTWRWDEEADIVTNSAGVRFHISALPFLIEDDGQIAKLGAGAQNISALYSI